MENEEPENLEGVHLMFDSEAADLLPMVVRYNVLPLVNTYEHNYCPNSSVDIVST